MELPVNQILCGNALEVLKDLPENSINCSISSPPYWGLRDYGVEGQLGLEPTFEEYIDKLLNIYDEVKRVLRKDGTCFVNLGDTYAGGGRGYEYWGEDDKQSTNKGSAVKCPKIDYPSKSLCLIPQRFAIGMVERGWILRNVIIWHKPNPMPSSAKDRFTVDFEYIYFFTKNQRYYFEPQFEPLLTESNAERPRMGQGQNTQYNQKRGEHKNLQDKGLTTHSMHKNKANGLGEPKSNPNGKNMRTVWTIPIQPFNSVVSYGSYRITSPNCSIHGCQACRFPARQYGEQQGVCSLLRNLGIDICRVSKQLISVVAKSSNLSEFPSSEFSAIVRNIQNHKMEVWLKLNEICGDKSPFRIECNEQYSRFASMSGHNYGNNILAADGEGEREICPLAQILFHNASILAFSDSLNNCHCNYIGKVEKNQDHFAVFPEKLVEPMIKAGCPEEGIVLDPFCGSGTTLQVAARLNRNYIGIELNQKYINEITIHRVNEGETGITIQEQKSGQKALFS